MHDKDPRPPPNSAYHAGAEFLIQGDYPLKLHKSYMDQVALLKSRGLIIHDEFQAAKVLETVNYYRLSGYLHEFKKNGEDCYIDGLSFEKVLALYHFDAKLTRVLMYALEDVEESLKTRFSYVNISREKHQCYAKEHQ